MAGGLEADGGRGADEGDEEADEERDGEFGRLGGWELSRRGPRERPRGSESKQQESRE